VVRRRLLWVVLIGIALTLGVLVASHDQGSVAGLNANDFGSLVYHVGLVVFVGSAVLVMFRERLSQALEAALFWTLIGFILAFGYTYRAELRGIADRVMAELVPGRAVQRSERTVEIVRGRDDCPIESENHISGRKTTLYSFRNLPELAVEPDANSTLHRLPTRPKHLHEIPIRHEESS